MYNYETEKSAIFTDEGQRDFIKFRDNAKALLEKAGACRMQEMMRGFTGSAWTILAFADRMVELGDLREITGSDVAGQHRVFVKKWED